MARYTAPTDDGTGYMLNGVADEEAAARLALFENIYEDLLREQEEIAGQMEALRAEGKKNSVKFKELMGKKLANGNTLMLFKAYGLEP